MHSLSLPRTQALAAAVLLIGVLILGGRLLLRAEPSSPAEPAARAAALSAPAPRPLVVHVVGAVKRPGLYRLADGLRIADAVARAGGATVKADLQLVNLAAGLVDGQQIVVPERERAAAGAPGAPTGARQGPVHLNTATAEELDALPGVGPVTAQKIIEYRQTHGAFSSVDDLDAIPGIGPARLEELRKLLAP